MTAELALLTVAACALWCLGIAVGFALERYLGRRRRRAAKPWFPPDYFAGSPAPQPRIRRP
jgi:hypothetical protein